MGMQLNEDRQMAVTLSLNVASVAANTTAEQAFALPGLRVGDLVQVTKPSPSAGLVVGTARVSAPDTLAVTFGNLTGGAIDPAAETYTVLVFRPEKVYSNAVPAL